MYPCYQSLVTLASLWEKLSKPQFYKDLTRKIALFEGWSWFYFNNLGLVLDMNLKFYTSVANGFKLKVINFWELLLTSVEITGEKLVEGAFLPPSPSWVGLTVWKVLQELSMPNIETTSNVSVKLTGRINNGRRGTRQVFEFRHSLQALSQPGNSLKNYLFLKLKPQVTCQ